jgi:putative flippase GtrA
MNSVYARFLVFGVVGASGTVLHYLVLIALVHQYAMHALWASSLGALVGAATNYLLNYSVTFRSRAPHCFALPRFFAIAGIGFVLNGLTMGILLRFGVHFLVAQFLATLLVLVSGFVGSQYWAFREKL